MSIEWNPGVTFEGGRYIAAGIDRAAQSIGDAIIQHRRDLQEKQGYQTILKALSSDPNNGIDPDAIDKMTLPQAKSSIVAAEIKRQQAAQKQTATANAAVPGFLRDVAGNMQPQPGNPAATPPGQLYGALATGAVPPTTANQPGMNALLATITAASKNPAVLNTTIGQNVLQTAIKQGMVQPKTPTFTKDPQGQSIAIDPTGRVQWAPGSGQRGDAKEPYIVSKQGSDGKTYDAWFDPTTGKTSPLREPAGPGAAIGEPPAGMTPPKGWDWVWTGKTWAMQRASKQTNGGSGADLLMRIMKGDSQTSKEAKPAQGGYEIGATYAGLKYLGGNPNDEASWQK